MRFSLFGCRVQVDFWFAAMAALMLVLGDPAMVCALLVSSMLHELGHVGALLLSGGTISSLRLSAFGMCMERQGGLRLSYWKEALCAWAGPAVNLLLGAVSYCIGERGWDFAAVNFCIGAFNLLPAVPMDGGRGLYFFLLSRMPQALAGRLMTALTFVTLFFLFLFGVLLLFRSKYNFSMLLVSLYLLVYIMIKPIEE